MATNAFELVGKIALDGSRRVQQGLSDVSDKADDTGKKFGKLRTGAQRLGKGLLKAGAWAGGAAAAGFATLGGIVGTAGIQFNAMQEQSQVAWETLLGTTDAAKGMIDQINQFAARTPFAVESVDMMAKYMHNAGYEGEQMFNQLMKISDTASAFALPAAEAQEMARQMSQVQQAGVAYTEDLNILQDRGIPIFKAIAESQGIAVKDVKKWASEGKISAEVYNEAFDSIAGSVEGASDAQSKTLNGMISTLKDNFGMLAGAMTEGAFAFLKDILPPVIEGIGEFTDLVKDKGVAGAFKEFLPAPIVDFITGAVESIRSAVKGLFTSDIAGSIGGFGDLFGEIVDKVSPVAEFLFDFGKQLFEGLEDIWPTVQQVFDSFMQGIGSLDGIMPFLTSLKDIFFEVFGFITDVIKGVAPIVAGTFERIMPLINELIVFFTETIMPQIMEIIAGIRTFWEENGQQIMQGLQNFADFIVGVIQFAMPIIKGIIESVWSGIKNIIQGAVTVIQGIIKFFTGIFTGDFALMWQGVKDIFSGGVQALWGFIQTWIVGKILGKIKSFGKKAIEPFKNVFKGAKENFGKLKDFVGDIVDDVIGFFKGLGKKLGFDIPKPKLPRFSIKNWSKNPLDWLNAMPRIAIDWRAQGGFLNGSQLIGAGEVNEAILPLENRKNMQPFAAAVAENLQQMQTAGGMQRLEVPIALNGREILRAIIPDLDRELARKRKRQSGLVNRGNL